MFDAEIIKIAIRNLRYQKLRTVLTLLGIIIGISAIVALISIGDSLQGAIDAQFEALGTDKILLMPGAPNSPGFSGSAFTSGVTLTDDDIQVIERVNGVDIAMGMTTEVGKIEFGTETQYTMISTFPGGEGREIIESMQGYEIADGRDLEDSDKYSAVIGSMAANDLFEDELRIRNRIKINGKTFKIIGIMKKIGNPIDDMMVIIPQDASDILKNPDEYSYIFIDTEDNVDVSEVRNEIEEELEQSRDALDFKLQTFNDLRENVNVVLSLIKVIFVGISAISLVVGGIGIMNTMLMSVLERTKEIGIMKAIGATNKRVLMLFLFESSLLGLIGGIIGISIGLGASFVMAILASQYLGSIDVSLIVKPWLIPGAMLFSMLVGILSGVIPARRAAKMDPTEALRYE